MTRDPLDEREGDALDELRTATAAAAGTEPPELRERFRVNPRQLMMAVGALVAVAVLLSRVGDPVEFWESIRDADWGTSRWPSGWGSPPTWPSRSRSSAPCPSASRCGRASSSSRRCRSRTSRYRSPPTPRSRCASSRRTVSTWRRRSPPGACFSTVTELIVQAGLFAVALWLSPDSIDFGRIDTGQIVVVVLAVVFLVGVAAAVVVSVRRLRQAVLPRVLRAARSMATRCRARRGSPCSSSATSPRSASTRRHSSRASPPSARRSISGPWWR